MALRNIFKYIYIKQQLNLFCSNKSAYTFCFLKQNKINTNCYRYKADVSLTEYEEIDEHFEAEKLPLRNILYANSNDPLILQLNECASVQNVLNIIRENHKDMNAMHISQAILVLWDLQKIFYKHNIFFENDSNSNELLSRNAILQNYMHQVNSHEDFETLIKLIEENYRKFSVDALTCTLLYLNRMGVKIKTKVMQLMIMRCENEIKQCDKNTFPLTSLSRFVVTVYSQESLYPILVCINAVPIILHRLEYCQTEKDFKLLTICLYKMKGLITRENLEEYKRIGEKLINNNIITKDNPRTIIKTIQLLNKSEWFEYNTAVTNKFIHLLKGSISLLTAREVLSLFKVFQLQKEPADMLQEMQDHASNLLYKNEDNSDENSLDLLSCVVSFSSPLNRPKFEKLARRYIQNNLTSDSLTSLYKILYYLKSSDTKLCNSFWDKYLQIIQQTSNDKLQDILNLCYKYTHFNRDVGYRYRYQKFERLIIEYLNNQLNTNILTLIPSKFARIASFIIAYSEDHTYVEKIVDQLLEMAHRFSSNDCLNISKGLQIFNENTHQNDQIRLLNSALNARINDELQINTSLPNVNILFRNLTLRKENIENELFKKLLNCYVVNSKELTSHIIRELTFCLQINNCLVPDVINKMTDYIIKKNDNILGNTVDKILHLCYSLGYTADNFEDFLNVSSEIIKRDKDRFTGLTFLKSCLALCYYQKLPDELIKHVFSVEFLENLDEELSNCYAKTTYPIRVRDYLMQLNRAVCLDYPELNVPWFHQKYINTNNRQASRKDFFRREVHAVLSDLLKDTSSQILEDTYSPYGYFIDFELKSDENVVQKQNFKSKTALLLLNSKAITKFTPNIKGYHKLKQRHLEILGYDVIIINYAEWKSFYTKENCREYIKNKIWPICNKKIDCTLSL